MTFALAAAGKNIKNAAGQITRAPESFEIGSEVDKIRKNFLNAKLQRLLALCAEDSASCLIDLKDAGKRKDISS